MKMRRVKILAPVLFLLLAFTLPASAGGIKIGYADLQKALNRSDAGVNAKEALKGEAAKLEKELNAEQAQIKKCKQEIDKKKNVWKKNTLMAKEKAFNARAKAFQKKFVKYNDSLNKKKVEKEAEIIKELRSIVKELAKKKGYTYVFEKSGGGILYAPPTADLTDDVIKAFNIRTREESK